jgi:phage terminase large subunit
MLRPDGTLEADFPEKLEFLFKPARYKIAYGGRGSGKSWGFARALIIMAAKDKKRILCAREVQKSIKQSVHTLLADQIKALGLGHLFEVLETEIRSLSGSVFTFAGLAGHTVESIKSVEGADICWVEEAQTVSKKSWEILIPTIRKPGSEIWVSFNPALATDDTYQRFVVNPPAGAVVCKINWSDNPWFPEELQAEREHLKNLDPESYKNVWEGECKYLIEGAIYKAEIERVKSEGRLTAVPYDPVLQVHTFWDLGVGDSTTIWFVQQAGKEVRVIDYYEASGEGLPHYADVLQRKGYLYGKHWAPHDIQVRELGSGRSRIETAATLGIKFDITPNIPIEDGIHAARMLFPRCYFDEHKTKRGIECLCNYRREFNDKLGEFKATPVHDWASHGADAFRYLAVALEDSKHKTEPKRYTPPVAAGGWMR